jgi:hypothetical protein
MDFRTLARGAEWMTEEDRKWIRRFAQALRTQCERANVRQSPMLVLRAEDVAHSAIQIHLLERRFKALMTMEADEDKRARALGTHVDAIGKARERLRKAIKELEEYLAKAGAPDPNTVPFADRMRPIMHKAEGVIEELLAAAERGEDLEGGPDEDLDDNRDIDCTPGKPFL